MHDQELATTAEATGADNESVQRTLARVMSRRGELEALLEALPEDDLAGQSDIYRALATINELLSGDLATAPALVVVDLNRWLERNKHLS